MKSIGDLIEERADLVTQQRELLDGAEQRSGGLTTSERQAYDHRDAEIRGLELMIDESRWSEEPAGGGPSPDGEYRSRRPRRSSRALSDDQEGALRIVEKRSAGLDSESGDRLVDLIERDRSGSDSRYLQAVADPAYRSAFAKRIARPDVAHLEFTEDEARAVSAVAEVMSDRRAMSVGSDTGGGFAVPYELDPTIWLRSDGAINPLRQLADSITIDHASEWRGITSEGVEAHFVPEATEASDDSPVLEQPVVKPERAQAFVPYSTELADDWDGLVSELGRLFADAKDVLEAEKFLTGSGEDEPEGLLTGLAEGSFVKSATKEKVVAGDVYALQEALPPRFQPNASWLSSLAVANQIYRFWSPKGEEPPLFNPERTQLLGKPWDEVSGLSSKTTTTAEEVLVNGDIHAGFKIVDRIGLVVEVVQHLFGANQRPTGQRGLYARWRVGSGVMIDNAIRVLQVK